tara:strand:- start:924 stop:1136 length:213 start_codon:yes stop_codon:yes gene_type:complete
MANVYEIFFFMKYYGSWSFTEAYSLPIGLRAWFVERLSQQLKDEAEAREGASKGSKRGTPLSANSPARPK